MAETNDHQQEHIGGLKDFINHTNVIGNVIAAASSQKNSFEPLPFANYSLFDESYESNLLKIHVNLQTDNKCIFLPKTPIDVSVKAERKHGAHIFHPYVYTLKFKHAQYTWEVHRSYKEIKDCHKVLAKLVKQDLGKSCSDINEHDIKPDWPLFPTEHDHLISSALIDNRCKNLGTYLQRLLTYPPYRDHEHVLHLLGVSPISFVIDLGPSLIEGVLCKRTGDNVYYGHFSKLRICCDKVKLFHNARWFAIKDSYIAYLDMEKNWTLRFVMLVTSSFKPK